VPEVFNEHYFYNKKLFISQLQEGEAWLFGLAHLRYLFFNYFLEETSVFLSDSSIIGRRLCWDIQNFFIGF